MPLNQDYVNNTIGGLQYHLWNTIFTVTNIHILGNNLQIKFIVNIYKY